MALRSCIPVNCFLRHSLKFCKITCAKTLYSCTSQYFTDINSFGTSTRHQLCSSNVKTSMNDLITTSFIEGIKFLKQPAVYDLFGLYNYEDLLKEATILSNKLRYFAQHVNEYSEKGPVCCLLCPNDSRYVYSLWGAWLSRYVVVPLSTNHPDNMLGYFIDDCHANVILYTKEFESVTKRLLSNRPKLEMCLVDHVNKKKNIDTGSFDDKWIELKSSTILTKEPALVVYTSGTTGNPKGVLHTHGTLHAMVQGMIKSWGWSSKDVIIHSLPLNHVHGIINALLTPLTCGALTIMLPKFDPLKVWELLLNPDSSIPRGPSIFMGVPTMYSLLMNSLEGCGLNKVVDIFSDSNQLNEQDIKSAIKKACLKSVRMFVSGSAPLPVTTMDAWENLTGHKLLERYGMTELGMALTNPLNGPRIPGAVGLPFPSVEVAIGLKNSSNGYDIMVKSNDEYTLVLNDNHKSGGDLLVKGPTVFKEYLNKPDETKEAFTNDGWFITGDTASYNDSNHTFRILGRTSVDVIKSGGYKLSALEIENHMARHCYIKEVAVLGLPDPVWGQKVAALVVLKNDLKENEKHATTNILNWCKDNMATYQVPKLVKVVKHLERNAMGKLNKKGLLKQYGDAE